MHRDARFALELPVGPSRVRDRVGDDGGTGSRTARREVLKTEESEEPCRP
jgi:hypothetical protein